MKFDTVAWAGVSECKRYAVALSSVNGRYLHTASFLPGERKMAQVLGARESREAAEQLCREHAAKKTA